MRKQQIIKVDNYFHDQCYEIAQKINNNNVAIVKVLMADNLKRIIDEFKAKRKGGEIPQRMKDLIELADHVTKSMKLSPMQNELAQNDIVKMMKRDQINDIFRDNAFNNEHKYNDSNFEKRQILYRFSSRIFRKTIDRIRCILSLGLAKGILHPLLILKRIELQKKLFIMDLDCS